MRIKQSNVNFNSPLFLCRRNQRSSSLTFARYFYFFKCVQKQRVLKFVSERKLVVVVLKKLTFSQ